MAGLPEVTVVGILGDDPQLCLAPSSAAVANFTVAANSRWDDGKTLS